MVHAFFAVVSLGHQQVESGKSAVALASDSQNSIRLEQGGNQHPVPTRVDRLIDEGRLPPGAGVGHFSPGARQEFRHLGFVKLHARGDGAERLVNEQHVFRGVVMHLALRFNVVVKGGNARLRPVERGVQFVQRPGEVIAVVVKVDVRVLAGVKAGLGMRQHVFKEAENSQGDFAKEFVAGNLIGAQVISQQAGVVVRHLLEVGHNPALVHRVAMKAAADLVVDAAPPHVFERGGNHVQRPLLAGLEINLEEQIDGGGMGKFGGAAEAAVLRIEHAADAFDDRLHHLLVGRPFAFLEVFHLAQSFGNFRGAVVNLVALGAVIVRNGFQQALHARAAAAVVGREVSAPKERLAIGSEKGRERPAPLAGQGAHRHLVAGVDVGALVAIDLYGMNDSLMTRATSAFS